MNATIYGKHAANVFAITGPAPAPIGKHERLCEWIITEKGWWNVKECGQRATHTIPHPIPNAVPFVYCAQHAEMASSSLTKPI